MLSCSFWWHDSPTEVIEIADGATFEWFSGRGGVHFDVLDLAVGEWFTDFFIYFPKLPAISRY